MIAFFGFFSFTVRIYFLGLMTMNFSSFISFLYLLDILVATQLSELELNLGKWVKTGSECTKTGLYQ